MKQDLNYVPINHLYLVGPWFKGGFGIIPEQYVPFIEAGMYEYFRIVYEMQSPEIHLLNNHF